MKRNGLVLLQYCRSLYQNYSNKILTVLTIVACGQNRKIRINRSEPAKSLHTNNVLWSFNICSSKIPPTTAIFDEAAQ